MNFRCIVSGYRLWKRAGVDNSFLWKRACTTVAAPTAVASGGKASASAQAKKRKMCIKLRNLSETGGGIAESLNQFIREEGVSVTQRDLLRWAKYLEKHAKDQHALEIFEWMERNHMSFSPSQHAIILNLIAKTKGTLAAKEYFKHIDPNFNNLNQREKNWPAYQKLADWMYPESYLRGLSVYLTEPGQVKPRIIPPRHFCN